MTSGHDVSAHLWDMPTKVEGGECAVGMVKPVCARMWRGVRQSEGAQKEREGVWGECKGVCKGACKGVRGNARGA